jgi:hypothetical protein
VSFVHGVVSLGVNSGGIAGYSTSVAGLGKKTRQRFWYSVANKRFIVYIYTTNRMWRRFMADGQLMGGEERGSAEKACSLAPEGGSS